ncbi:hypothetical protein BRADI_2g42938v3 [Brachypodium distachyon]|uniref:Uncharacterized protein n=1 Tax=Brachypodium distachyon TaxID=15368 RepID=A0A2K2DDL0_BRADI|nr:hypothetical protein BRADI_2g42938v3 [Brachypodium distachyon]
MASDGSFCTGVIASVRCLASTVQRELCPNRMLHANAIDIPPKSESESPHMDLVLSTSIGPKPFFTTEYFIFFGFLVVQ